MDNILTQIEEKFKSKIEEIIKEGEIPKLDYAEKYLLAAACEFTREALAALYEQKDAELREDKKRRKAEGLVVERKGDKREVVTRLGILRFNRTYYQKNHEAYVYPIDEIAGIEAYQRVSGGTTYALVESAIRQSYAKASMEVTGGIVSKQTVMNSLRKATVPKETHLKLRKVPYLHIDADEDHVKMVKRKGGCVNLPEITVYEGVEHQGKRGRCINSFSISEYGMKPDEIWEKVLTEVESRYDLNGTQVYIHGDGAAWIKKAFEWFPNATFVLDQYHKNKYIKRSTADFPATEGNMFQRKIRTILSEGTKEDLLELQADMCGAHPEKTDNIEQATGYLYDNFDGIVIRRKDSEANNGGCTEPHVSHILSSRLSTRPMAWSAETLKHIAPILAAGVFTMDYPNSETNAPIRCKVRLSNKTVRAVKNTLGLPDPDLAVDIAGSFEGHLNGLYSIIRTYTGLK